LSSRVLEDHQRTVHLGEERCEEPDQETLLQLEHVGVEAAAAVAMSLDVEKEPPPLAGLYRLGPADEREERSRRFLEPLVRVDDVVERHVPVVLDRLRTPPLIYGAILPRSRISPPEKVRQLTNEAAVATIQRGRGQVISYS